jgi:hypothetical protein
MNYFECCMGCVAPKRYPGCSGSCPDYKEARAIFDNDKAKHAERMALKYYINEHSTATKDGIAKYVKKRPRKFRYS